MSEPQKKPGVAFWATVVVVCLLVGYPLSLGPLMWLRARNLVPGWSEETLRSFYAPLHWVTTLGAEPNNYNQLGRAINWYSSLWL
jgi:hypothetical protein